MFPIPFRWKINKPKIYTSWNTRQTSVDRCMMHTSKHRMLNLNNHTPTSPIEVLLSVTDYVRLIDLNFIILFEPLLRSCSLCWMLLYPFEKLCQVQCSTACMPCTTTRTLPAFKPCSLPFRAKELEVYTQIYIKVRLSQF